MVTPT